MVGACSPVVGYKLIDKNCVYKYIGLKVKNVDFIQKHIIDIK